MSTPRLAFLSIALIILTFFPPPLLAQHPANLVLEGAGIKGIAYVGAIKQLEEMGMIENIVKVGGTSAGAIAALAISLGYNSKEIEDLIYKTKLQKFNDGKFFFIGGIARMNRHYGWYKGRAFANWLEKIISDKTGNGDITFKELHDRRFKDLYVTGTSLNHQRLIVFSHETYPQMNVKDAVRISMSIPLYFEAVMIDSSGYVLNRKGVKGYYDLVVDGGFTGNFPITLFDSVTQYNGVVKRFPNPATIGLRIDTPEQIKYDSLQQGLAPVPIARFKNYLSAFYRYVIENLNRGSLSREDWMRTVSISSGDISSRIRKLSAEEKKFLIDNGYIAMKNYLLKARHAQVGQ